MEQTLKLLDIDLPSPRGPAPKRRAGSVRRTTSIDVTWPGGPDQPMAFHGYGRDIYTDLPDQTPEILTVDELFAEIDGERIIRAIHSIPERPGIGELVGVRGGGKLRRALNDALPGERRQGSPLYLLIDDLAGASLVSNWALFTAGYRRLDNVSDADMQQLIEQQSGVCIGFRPGSSALDPNRPIGDRQNSALVAPLHHPHDAQGWHPLHYGGDLSFRRARRIDLWQDGDIFIDTCFQDSAARPSGEREAVHEYSLTVRADPETLMIKSIEATPHILPFPECPNAIESVHKMIGQPLADMRNAVLETFPRVKGCTHLNDCMRSIAEVPVLVAALHGRRPEENLGQ